MEFKEHGSDTEANGRAIQSIVQGIVEVSPAFERQARSILEDNGIPDPTPGEWYSMRSYLDALEELEASVGPRTVERIGRQIPKSVEWPAHIDDVPAALDQLDDVYQANHRGGVIGHYEFERLDENHGRVECRNPYPCSLDTGLIEGTMNEFADSGSFTRVSEDSDCRADGARSCTYDVKW